MADDGGFASSIVSESDYNEIDVAIAVAWYLHETREVTVNLDLVCDFAEAHGIRRNINRTRLRKNLVRNKDVYAAAGKPIAATAQKSAELRTRFERFLDYPIPQIKDDILVLADFTSARSYVKDIARQINGAYQFCLYDACAVMMRRLVEVLIIDAFEAKGERAKILKDGEYQMMSGLIGSLNSGQVFKLSRNSKKWLERLKELGDNAAHSRTYITKKIDIDDFKGSFRNLVSELQKLG